MIDEALDLFVKFGNKLLELLERIAVALEAER